MDLLTADVRVLPKDFWSGLSPDIRKGGFDDPLGGVIRFGGDEPVDIVVAKFRWQREVVERSQAVSGRGLSLPVPSITDLILWRNAWPQSKRSSTAWRSDPN